MYLTNRNLAESLSTIYTMQLKVPLIFLIYNNLFEVSITSCYKQNAQSDKCIAYHYVYNLSARP